MIGPPGGAAQIKRRVFPLAFIIRYTRSGNTDGTRLQCYGSLLTAVFIILWKVGFVFDVRLVAEQGPQESL